MTFQLYKPWIYAYGRLVSCYSPVHCYDRLTCPGFHTPVTCPSSSSFLFPVYRVLSKSLRLCPFNQGMASRELRMDVFDLRARGESSVLLSDSPSWGS